MAKRAYDGSPLWTCEHCGQSKRRKDMHVHGEKNVCKACHDDTGVIDRGELSIEWAIERDAPDAESKELIRAIWAHVRPFLCYYRMAENRKKFNNAMHKERALTALFRRTRKFPQEVHEPILRAMCGYDINERALLWLALRPGVFDRSELRQVAVEAAEQAVQFTELATHYPTVHGVFNTLHQCVRDASVHRLQLPREQVYNVQQALAGEVFVKPQLLAAANAVGAACFRDSADAAVIAMSWAYQALEHEDVEPDTIIENFADIVRRIAMAAAGKYDLPEVKHWAGLEEV